jgi:hypothetical protein
MSALDAFDGSSGVTWITSSSQPSVVAAAWGALREAMIKNRPEPFTRDEWAYLIHFLEPSELLSFVEAGFGRYTLSPNGRCTRFARGRDSVVVVLPNNVSLLGPLMIMVATLSAQRIWVKIGTRGADLVRPFLDFASAHAAPGLRHVLSRIEAERLDRDHSKVKQWLETADVRIAFGSDRAVSEIERSPHKPTSRFLGFGDMYSEAWLVDSVSDEVIDTLIKVFAIYGRAGCTSPRRVVILDGNSESLAIMKHRLVSRWPLVVRQDVPMHIASENVMQEQLCRSLGIEATLTHRNAALITTAPLNFSVPPALMTMVVCGATLFEAVSSLPDNIQTLGLSVASREAEVRSAVLTTSVRRVMPLDKMHHFGPVWDGNLLPQVFFDVVECAI